jgi:hypothetical protein
MELGLMTQEISDTESPAIAAGLFLSKWKPAENSTEEGWLLPNPQYSLLASPQYEIRWPPEFAFRLPQLWSL